MKVKIGDKIYDGEKQPVMIILTDKDKQNITDMLPEAHRYCMFPDEIPIEEIKKFMKIECSICNGRGREGDIHSRGLGHHDENGCCRPGCPSFSNPVCENCGGTGRE